MATKKLKNLLFDEVTKQLGDRLYFPAATSINLACLNHDSPQEQP